MENAAWRLRMVSDYQQAETVRTQVAANARKNDAKRWKLLQDTMTKMFEMQQETMAFKARTRDKISGKWDEYIRG